MVERFFGRIMFPQSNETPMEGVWLTLDNRRIYIEAPFPIHTDGEWPIVLGEFTGDSGFNKVTFIDVKLQGGTLGAGGSFRRMNINSLLKGVHIPNQDELIFKTAIVKSTALLNWFRVYHTVDISSNAKILTIPESLDVFDKNLRDFRLRFCLQFGGSFGYHDISLEHLCFGTIDYINPMYISEIHETIILLRKFILFVTNDNPNFSRITLQRHSDEFIEWLITFPVVDATKFSTNIQTDHSVIEPHLNTILRYWFENDKFQFVIDLLLEQYFNTNLSIPRYFQNMCVALESYHSNFIQNKLPVSSEVVKNRKYILDLLQDSPDVLDWFDKQSQFWINPQFADRLNTYRDLLARLFGETIDCDINDLVTKIKQTRNEITHQGNPHKRFNHTELILAAKTLEFAIKLSILKEFGVTIEKGDFSIINEFARRIEILASINSYTHQKDRIRRK